MYTTLNDRKIELKRFSEINFGTRRISLYCDEKDLEQLKADVIAHGAGTPIVIHKDDGGTLTYENGYTKIDSIERTIATGEDDVTRIDLNLIERPIDEKFVIEPEPEPEAAPDEGTETTEEE